MILLSVRPTPTACSRKSPVIRLFIKQLMRTHIKELSKSVLLALCEGNASLVGEFPAQRASNAEKNFPLMTSSCHKLASFSSLVFFIFKMDDKWFYLWHSTLIFDMYHYKSVYYRDNSGYGLSQWETTCIQNKMDFPQKGPVTRKTYSCHDVIMICVCENVWGVDYVINNTGHVCEHRGAPRATYLL